MADLPVNDSGALIKVHRHIFSAQKPAQMAHRANACAIIARALREQMYLHAPSSVRD